VQQKIHLANYFYSDAYIYSIAVRSQYYFVYIEEYENITSHQTFFTFQTIANCNVSQNHKVIINVINKYQRNSIIGIDYWILLSTRTSSQFNLL